MPADLTSGRSGRSILVVDDHAMLLRSIGMVVEAVPGASLAGTAKSGRDALDQLGAGLVADVVLIDVVMPGLTGPELVRECRRLEATRGHPRRELILISTERRGDLPADLLASGADGFVLKDDLTVEAIRSLIQR